MSRPNKKREREDLARIKNNLRLAEKNRREIIAEANVLNEIYENKQLDYYDYAHHYDRLKEKEDKNSNDIFEYQRKINKLKPVKKTILPCVLVVIVILIGAFFVYTNFGNNITGFVGYDIPDKDENYGLPNIDEEPVEDLPEEEQIDYNLPDEQIEDILPEPEEPVDLPEEEIDDDLIDEEPVEDLPEEEQIDYGLPETVEEIEPISKPVIEYGSQADDTPRTCSGVWGASCDGADPATSDYSWDCSCGSYYSNGFWVDEVYVNATVVKVGDTIKVTCNFDCYSTASYNEWTISYWNTTEWVSGNYGTTCTDGNYTAVFTTGSATGEHRARCSIGYQSYNTQGETCMTGTYSDNDDVNFTVESANDAPVISLITPQNDSIDANGYIILEYNVIGDSLISNCSLIVDGSEYYTDSNITRDITMRFNVSLTKGNYVWGVNCTDSAGNIGASEERQVDVDTICDCTLEVNTSIIDSNRSAINATVDFIDAGSDETDYNGSGEQISVRGGKYKIRVRPANNPIKDITFNGVNLTGNLAKIVDIDNVPLIGDYVEVYAIDPTNLNFTNATVTVNATGTNLYKCAGWNFTEQKCDGSWELFKTGLVEGQEYTFILTANDPGFAEIRITSADHLNETRDYIESVYEEVRERDYIFKEIPANHYIRATFEENLTSNKDITIYAKSDYSGASVEVYEKNQTTKIADFGTISDDKKYKVYLTNLQSESQDTFDLKVTGNPVEFDYIVDPPWANSSFDKCMNITISNAGSTTLTNFPAYINLTYYPDMLSTYHDLRFYNTSCNNDGILLDYEIENYTSSKADIWVRILSLPSTGKTISVYYKNNTVVSSGENPTGVWDSNFKGVWHLKEDPSGTAPQMNDSTSNNNDGTSAGVMTSSDQVAGKVDGSLEHDGGNDEISAGNPASLQITGSLTIEAWAKPAVSTGRYHGITGKLRYASGDYAGYSLMKHNTDVFRFQICSADASDLLASNSAYVDTDWHYIVGKHTGSTSYLYVDGVEQTATGTRVIEESANVFHIGRQYYDVDDRWWSGLIDEVRVSNISRSADWINQTYQMIENQGTFVSFGTEENATDVDWNMTSLDIGTVLQGSSNALNATVTATSANTNVLVTNVSGNGTGFITASPTDLSSMSGGDTKEVRFNCSPPSGQAIGYYEAVFNVNSSEDTAGDNITINCTVAEVAVSWNQSALDLGSGLKNAGNQIGYVNITSVNTNTDVNVTCVSGNCSIITENWDDTTDMTDEQSLNITFTCDDDTSGNLWALYNVSSVQDNTPNQINVSCIVQSYLEWNQSTLEMGSILQGKYSTKNVTFNSTGSSTGVKVINISGNGTGFIIATPTNIGDMNDNQIQEVMFNCSPSAVQAIGYYEAIFNVNSSENKEGNNITVSCNVALNLPPTTPTNITCNGGDCNISVDESVILNCSGSTDADDDIITYSIEASLANITTIENITDISKTGEVGEETDYTTRTCSGVWGESCDGADPDVCNYSWSCCAGSYTSSYLVNEVYVNATNAYPGDTIKVTCNFDCHSIAAYNHWTISYWNTTDWVAGAQGDACSDGNYTATFTAGSAIGEHRVRCSIGDQLYNTAGETCMTGSFSDNDDANFQVISTSPATNETNTTTTNYTDINSNYSKSITNITVKVEVNSYNPSASVQQDTNDPDLYLEIYNGSLWIEIGEFDLNETYAGDGLNTTNVNFSQSTTDSTILEAWNNSINQDIRIKGIYMDYYDSTIIDEINYTNVWIEINGKKWSYIGNHTNGTTYDWSTINITEQTGIDLRCRAIDLDGTNTYSSYFTKGSYLNISHIAPDVDISTNATSAATSINVNATYLITITNNGSSGTNVYNITYNNTNTADTIGVNQSNISLAQGASGDILFMITDADPGEYNATITAIDADNASINATTAVMITTVQDSESPVVMLISPANNTWNTSRDINFTANATDNYGFANCSVYTNETAWSLKQTNTSAIINNTLFGINETFSADGVYLWNIYCCDTSGNCAFNATNYTIKVDSAVPVFSNAINTSVDFKRYSNFTANITIDNTALDYYIFSTNVSGSWANDTVDISGIQYNASSSKNITQPRGSNICWYYWANDTAGNSDVSTTYCFDVVNTIPTHTKPILNSTDGSNYTNQNLTCYNQSTYDLDGNSVKNIYNWYKNDSSIMVLNMPFEGGSTSGSTTPTNGTTKDYSGHGNNGTVISNTTNAGAQWNSTRGYDGKGAYQFDGKDDYIDVGYDMTKDNFTVSAWIKTSDKSMGIISAYLGSMMSMRGYSFNVDSNGNISFIYNVDLVTGTSVNDSVWHFVVATMENGNFATLYVDGDFKNNGGVFPGNNNYYTYIGATTSVFGSLTAFFNGTIDEVGIYNYTLSAEQIKSIYENRTDLIVSQETSVGDVWNCSITPNDGTEDGTTLMSDKLTVLAVPVNSVKITTNATSATTPLGINATYLITVTNNGTVGAKTYNITYNNTNTADTIGINDTQITLAQDASGTALFMITDADAGEYNATVTATDADNASVNATTNIMVTTVQDSETPVVRLISPANSTWNTSRNINFTANATDDVGFANCSLYTNESSWGLKQTNTSAIINNTLFGINETFDADGIYIWNIYCCDTTGNCAFNNTNWTIKIDSTPPTNATVILNSTDMSQNYTTDNLTCYANATDSFATTLTAYYKWYNNSIEVTSLAGSTTIPNGTITSVSNVSSGNTTKTQNWTCSVLISDGVNNASWVNSSSLTIQNTAPTHTKPILNSTDGSNDTNQNLTCYKPVNL